MQTEHVMGYEFDAEEAAAIRKDDLALRLLVDLQKHGVAKLCSLFSFPPCLKGAEGEYWTTYKNDSYFLLLDNSFEEVYAG